MSKTEEKAKFNSCSVEDCCRILRLSENDTDYIAALGLLPKILSTRELSAAEVDLLASELPLKFLSKMLKDEGEEAELYHSLALDVLSVVLSICSPTASRRFSKLLPLIVPHVNKANEQAQLERSVPCLTSLVFASEVPQTEIVHSTLTHVCAVMKTEAGKAPSLSLLRNIDTLLQYQLANVAEEMSSNCEWSMDLRVVVRRLLQSRNPGDDYRSVLFRICASSVALLDWRWFETDPDFCLLLGSLAAIELRLLLDKHPNEINSSDLIACCSLAEKLTEFVESDELDLNDQRATILSQCCQENAAFLAEYLVKGAEEQLVFPPQVLFPLYRVVCSFLAIGGATILDARLVRKCVVVLIDAANLAMEKAPDEFDAVALLLPSLPQLTLSLPNTTLAMLVRYVKQRWPTVGKTDAVDNVADVIAKMNGRGWLQEKDVVELAEFVDRLRDSPEYPRLISAVHRVRECAKNS